MLAAARLVQVVPVWVEECKPFKAGRWANRAGKPVARTAVDSQAGTVWPGMARVAGSLLARLAQRRQRTGAPFPVQTADRPAHPRPLRVLRVLEPQQPRAAAGRMVISGRMADVCAELDRLAAAEAANQP
ncbi:hypothetical protein ASF43_28040 [Pseudorhodoferax sp. Leaf267]|nr:hypothetical protein ASF43_28040 [Pseudorhodoferax sp. Leaf267]